MAAYAVIAFGGIDAYLPQGVVLLLSGVAYVLSIYLYYGIARLVYQGGEAAMWASTGAAFVIAVLLTGLSVFWFPLLGLGILAVSGSAIGKLSRNYFRPSFVYIFGAVVVTVLFSVQTYPIWREFLEKSPQVIDSFLNEMKPFLSSLGYTDEMVRDSLEQARATMEVMVRLFPAATILGALAQFSVGFLLFMLWAHRREGIPRFYIPMIHWKMPFGFTPLLVIGILMRLLGEGTIRLVADNMLAILAVYYCVAGLAVIEYYLRKLKISKVMRVLFYVMLFFTQVLGFFLLALLGFIDSFADWRRISTREIVEER